MTWSPGGDRLAYFVRTEKSRSLIIQNVVTGKIEDRIELQDGRRAGVAGLLARRQEGRVRRRCRAASATSSSIDLETKQITNLTKDEFADYAPTWSPDGKYIVYLARVSGNEKMFRLDLDTGRRRSSRSARTTMRRRSSSMRTRWSSRRPRPTRRSRSIPEVARNGKIYNIWTLNMKTGELSQFTDALGGNAVPGRAQGRQRAARIAFISYYKGDYGLHTLDRREPIVTAASADFGSPGPIIDFQAPLVAHAGRRTRSRRRGRSRRCSSTAVRR